MTRQLVVAVYGLYRVWAKYAG